MDQIIRIGLELAKMDFAAQVPTSRSGLVMPLDFPGCLASWIDRSRHLLLILQHPAGLCVMALKADGFKALVHC